MKTGEVIGNSSNDATALLTEMDQWKRAYVSDGELRPYGQDLFLRARVLIAKSPALVILNGGVWKRVSSSYLTLDTTTVGSVRSLVLSTASNMGYFEETEAMSDKTVDIVEFFSSPLHKGTNNEQVRRVSEAIKNAGDPVVVLSKGKIAFRLYPDGQVVDWLGVRNFPPSITLCAATLLDMEQLSVKKTNFYSASGGRLF